MNPVFADTAYYLALLSPDDELHAEAMRLTPDIHGGVVTTAWVLTELVDAMSCPPNRRLVVDFVRDWYDDPRVTLVPPSQRLLEAGLNLFERRADKEWSLTDGISFVVMEEQGLRDALTADHHFEQAGFHILLR
jgi:predicted nucleic acid-binding protein